MKDRAIIDVLIGNIKTDKELLRETEAKIEQAREGKRAITDRLKDYRRDISVLIKYVDDSKRKELEDLGFDFSEAERGMNPVAGLALDILVKAKGNQMTNGELYDAYRATFKNEDDAFTYTEFNIKCRSLFNTQRVLRKKGKDAKNSREDIISLNGRVVKATEQNEAKR